MADKESIVEKIQKLLTLAGDAAATEAEAKTAMLLAQKLMAEYSIQMQELKQPQKELAVNTVASDKIDNKWDWILASTIANNYRCRYYGNHTPRKGVFIAMFVGEGDDAHIAALMYRFARKVMNKGTSEAYASMMERYGYTKGTIAGYRAGFISGLNEQFEEQKRKHQEWGLVLVRSQRVDTYIRNNLSLMSGKQSKRTGSLHADSYNKGKRDGKELSLNRHLT